MIRLSWGDDGAFPFRLIAKRVLWAIGIGLLVGCSVAYLIFCGP